LTIVNRLNIAGLKQFHKKSIHWKIQRQCPFSISSRPLYGEATMNHRLFMRPSSLGGGRILRRTLSVRLSVRPVIITEHHMVPPSELQWHTCIFRHALTASVLFGTHWGPHIVRPSRPHKFLSSLKFYVVTRVTFSWFSKILHQIW